ncbi:hypothetical protein T12_8314 [Trichinella patagoniensis]|uniref:Uncharacterized protein n=1 Tax=Trichinella patagoniensis TaxID=990121 RepID=A0A0V1A6N3_9BILA|nr:hypothetical protein T12_8314 [Trichinella patagoniensis]
MQWTPSIEDLSLQECSCDFCEHIGHIERACGVESQSTVTMKLRLDSSNEKTGILLALSVHLACYRNASGFRGIFYHHFRTHPQPSLPSQLTTTGTLLLDSLQGLAVQVVGAASLVVEYGSFSSALKAVGKEVGMSCWVFVWLVFKTCVSIGINKKSIEEHAELFSGALAQCVHRECHSHSDHISEELDQLIDQGILELVQRTHDHVDCACNQR